MCKEYSCRPKCFLIHMCKFISDDELDNNKAMFCCGNALNVLKAQTLRWIVFGTDIKGHEQPIKNASHSIVIWRV